MQRARLESTLKPLAKTRIRKRKVDPEYRARVAGLPCSVCGKRPVEVHHKRRDRAFGKRADDTETFPLCREHHQGNEGIEKMALDAWEARFGAEDHHIRLTRKRLRMRRT